MSADNPQESERSISKRSQNIWPYANEKATLKAIEQYISLKTSPNEKRKILSRLLISDDYFKLASETLLTSFHRMDGDTRHLILDNIIRLIMKGEDFTEYSTHIAKLMNDSNYKFREKATNLLLHMGESAINATPRMISYLRSKLSDVQLSALKVISSIGPACAQQALPKLKSFLTGTSNKELITACERAIKILNGKEKPLRPTIKIEGVVENQPKPQKNVEVEDTETPAKTNLYPGIKDKAILIAEDQDSVRVMISRAINSCGGHTKEMNDGKMVLKLIQAKADIDLFILDLMMPTVSGVEVLKTIRSNPQYELTPVMIVSARSERTIKLKLAQFDICAYISKPFKLTELLASINNILAQN